MNTRSLLRAGVTTLMCLLPLKAVAQGAVALTPKGCTPVLTIHKTACAVSTIFNCPGGRQVLGYSRGELRQIHTYTSDWQLTGFVYQADGRNTAPVQMQMRGRLDPQRMLARLAAGETITVAREAVLNTGIIKNRRYAYTSTTKLTGAKRSLSGEVFQIATSQREYRLGRRVALSFTHELLISQSLGVLIEGSFDRGTFNGPDGTVDQNPVSLSTPNRSGFMATRANQGC